MAENDTTQEKTEDATPKRLREAVEKGQVPRSRELTGFLLMFVGASAVLLFGHHMVYQVQMLARESLTIERAALFSDTFIYQALMYCTSQFIFFIYPLLLPLFLCALFGPMLLSGWSFSTDAMQFKFDKLSIVSGLKRMFSLSAIMELVKALAKFMIIGAVACLVIALKLDSIIQLGRLPAKEAIVSGADILAHAFFSISLSMMILAFIDVPYQLWDHNKKLRMSKQEVRDEHKDVEGKPEIKAKVKQLQRQLLQNRMMQEVPKADVVITNPSHYAVALAYQPGGRAAPVLLAKGGDNIARKIREIAESYDIPVIEQPILARSLYHTTELNDEIPEGLYVAVAQVLAYVFQLKRYQRGQAEKPNALQPNIPVPDDYFFE